MTSPILPGRIVWTGDNPGIYLKDDSDRWRALALHFRVATSPLGSGAGILVLGAPDVAAGWPAAPNLFVSTSEPLMRWLVEHFVSRFATFRGTAALAATSYLAATSVTTRGVGRSVHEEAMTADGVSVAMRWEGLQEPFAVDVPAPSSATGEHRMLSVFLEARAGSILVDGRPLPGRVIERDFLGRRMSTAFLAFSETWLTPPAP